MGDKSENVLWFVTGVALGATIALLYAPSEGSDTRRKIMSSAEKGREALGDTGRDVFEKGKDLFDRGKQLADEAAELFDRGRKLVEG